MITSPRDKILDFVISSIHPMFGLRVENVKSVKDNGTTDGVNCWVVEFEDGKSFHVHQGYPSDEKIPENFPEIRFRTEEGEPNNMVRASGLESFSM